MTTAAFGLGSNLGNRLLNLRTAARLLQESGLEILQVSDVFESEPWGVADQPHFLNACLTAECETTPEALLAAAKDIEKAMGRRENIRWGARLIDIDILLIGDLRYETAALTIPHRDLHRRDFVLIPLAQLLPDWIHPDERRSVAEMAAAYPPLLRITSL